MLPFKVTEIKLVDRGKIYPKPESSFGEIWKWRRFWMLSCPRCGVSMLLQHTVTVKDGKVTISPSVGCSQCRAHFFVRERKIKELGDF